MITGTVRFNGMAIGSLKAELTKQQVHLEAVVAFVDTTTGDTHGWTKAEGRVWSPETMRTLQELTLSMERDLAKMHLVDAEQNSTQVATKPGLKMEPNVGGLGEHLGEGGVSSV